jgi:hypothetical protein
VNTYITPKRKFLPTKRDFSHIPAPEAQCALQGRRHTRSSPPNPSNVPQDNPDLGTPWTLEDGWRALGEIVWSNQLARITVNHLHSFEIDRYVCSKPRCQFGDLGRHKLSFNRIWRMFPIKIIRIKAKWRATQKKRNVRLGHHSGTTSMINLGHQASFLRKQQD